MIPKTNIAFKEWAVICKLLGEGRQILILRKGGIIEDGGEFKPEYGEFYLFPTFVHEQTSGLKPEVSSELKNIEAEQVKPGTVPISLLTKITDTLWVPSLNQLKELDAHHYWSEDTVQKRFHYGSRAGLFVLLVRMYKLPALRHVPLLDRYAGCKSWVNLEKEISTEDATPVLSDMEFKLKRAQIHLALEPISAR